MAVHFEENMARPSHDRSRSRGRDVLKSSGRGGIGNIHSSTLSDQHTFMDSVPMDGRDKSPSTMGGVSFTGRGGAGNSVMRPPSSQRTPSVQLDEKEDALIREAEHAHTQNDLHSSGRGGAGNILHSHGAADNHIQHSRSTSRSGSRMGRMVGRGGAGNFNPDLDGQIVDATMEEDDIEARRAHAEEARGREREAPHSSGRGGAANITTLPSPSPEAVLAHTSHMGESTGRGGVGNILRNARSPSNGPRSPSTEVSTGIRSLGYDEDIVGSRAVDSRGGARSSSRGPGRSRERSVEAMWGRITHPFTSRPAKETTITE